jgi:hypothetical protein
LMFLYSEDRRVHRSHRIGTAQRRPRTRSVAEDRNRPYRPSEEVDLDPSAVPSITLNKVAD